MHNIQKVVSLRLLLARLGSALFFFVLLPMAGTVSAMDGRFSLDVQLDQPDGFYRSGESIVCTAHVLRDGEPTAGVTGRCTVKFEQETIRIVEFDAGEQVTVTAASDIPGWVYFGFEILGDDGEPLRGPNVYVHPRKPTIVGEIGAMIDAEEIQAAPSRPDDFDAFWANRRARLDEVPMNPSLTPVRAPRGYEGLIECYAVEVQALGKTPVTGYLAFPVGAQPGGLPALVDYQSLVWADANRMNAVRAAADRAALALFVTWHGLPTGHPASYYREHARSWYEDGGRGGDTDPETWFWNDMFYRVLRALDFIKSRPEWNGEDLIVQGGSLGGGQAIAAAALDSQVTLAVIGVPSFCEFNGFKAGRRSVLSYRTPDGIARLKEDPRRLRTVAYFDAVNFAPRITGEIFVSTGFTDELCTPSSVYAFYNALPDDTPKAISTHPKTGHYGTTANVKGNRRLEDLFRNVEVFLAPVD